MNLHKEAREMQPEPDQTPYTLGAIQSSRNTCTTALPFRA